MARLVLEITPEDGNDKVSRFDFKLAFEELLDHFRRGARSGKAGFSATNINIAFTYTWSTEGEDLRHTHPN